MAEPEAHRTLNRSDLVILLGGGLAIVAAGVTRYVHVPTLLAFVCSAIAVALLAALVGRSVEQLGDRFGAGATGDTCVLLALATAALVLPSLAQETHSPAGSHIRVLSDIAAVVLLIVFVLSLPVWLRRRPTADGQPSAPEHEPPRWPLWLAVGLLSAAGGSSAPFSDRFVSALQPTINTLHLSQAFAGLVVVAIAGNAVENVVGTQLAMRNQANDAL